MVSAVEITLNMFAGKGQERGLPQRHFTRSRGSRRDERKENMNTIHMLSPTLPLSSLSLAEYNKLATASDRTRCSAGRVTVSVSYNWHGEPYNVSIIISKCFSNQSNKGVTVNYRRRRKTRMMGTPTAVREHYTNLQTPQNSYWKYRGHVRSVPGRKRHQLEPLETL